MHLNTVLRLKKKIKKVPLNTFKDVSFPLIFPLFVFLKKAKK